MSSRALRRAQREREEQEMLRGMQQDNTQAHASSSDEHDDPEPSRSPQASRKSIFAMLDVDQDLRDDDEDDNDNDDDASQDGQQPQPEVASAPMTTQSSTKRKKKKKKQKEKKHTVKSHHTTTTPATDSSLDEIDLALQSLSTKASAPGQNATSAISSDPASIELCRLLAIDSSHLHASNEVRRLFGRAALERDDDDNAAARQRNRGAQQMGLAAALRNRQGQGSRGSGLAALSLRRNIFIQGKEDWPVATGGGLSMEIVEKRSDGTVEYRYLHNRAYQDVQAQFDVCVASMDPNRMVQLLQYNPYHISTLLQVSEIAKQERDHATSGDLLERALFSFGRSVHSTFTNNLTHGKARLDFRRPENREFWLAANRYIANLGMRSTWRTVYEWAKLLLSLDPQHDPYAMALVLDQFAIRARSPQSFLDISNSAFFSPKWSSMPNIQLTRGLALVQTGEAGKGKQALYAAVSKYPWVVARLFQELNLDPPPAVWGKQPRTDAETLHTELYAKRAKDIWNTPEASNILVEVTSAISSDVPTPPVVESAIGLEEARHVLMTDDPALIAHLPRSITGTITSASDPLPPRDNLPSYTSTASVRTPPGSQRSDGALGSTAESLRELQGLYRFFAELFPWFSPNGDEGNGPATHPTEEEIERRIQQSGISEEVVVQRTQRLMELQQNLLAGDRQGDDDPPSQHARVEDAEDEE